MERWKTYKRSSSTGFADKDKYMEFLLDYLYQDSEDLLPKELDVGWVAPSLHPDDPGYCFYMNCNDVFAVATADSERVPRGLVLEFLFRWSPEQRITWVEKLRGEPRKGPSDQ